MKKIAILFSFLISLSAFARPVVMLTGYWVPTNEMLRPFSQNAKQNPGGWIGDNWENSGFDVIAFFPEFPEGSGQVGKGDFEVEPKKTEADFKRLTEALHPYAILSFGQGDGPWEIETRAPDYWKHGKVLPNTLPFDAIAKAVNKTGEVHAWVDRKGDAGDYLCGFLSRLGAQYHADHSAKKDPYPNRAQGFIHVGKDVSTEAASHAVLATLRAFLPTLSKK